MATDIIARAMAASGGGGGTPTDAYSKTETDALLKNKVGFAEYKDNKISFYNSSLKDNIIGEIDLPVDMVVDQIKTKFSQKFKFDETTYPDTENPNLDGKPVLVLAIKTSATADTFSFLNMESLVDVYTGGTTKSAIISVDPETGVITNVVRISAETGNRIVQKDDGLFVPNQSASDVSYSNTTSKLKATTTQAAIDETLNVANEKYIKPSTGIPSADMAQSVKDSLAKADTALQEADKTELQGEINDKLDKTAVLSDFSSEDLTNKVPSAQLALDSFAKKVTTEAVDNDTRIITVPENVDCFGSIAMIGGKTVKCKNLWKYGDFINVPSQRFVVEDSSVSFIKNGKTYTFSLNISGTELGSAFELQFRNGSDVVKSISGGKGFTSSTFTINGVVDNIRFYVNPANYANIQLEESSSATSYEPYHEDLWNAPVTEITSAGKNLFNGETISLSNLKKVGDSWINTMSDTRTTYAIIGRLYNGGTALGVSIPSTKFGDNIYYAKFTKTSDADSMTFGHSGATYELKFKFDISHLINGEEYIISATITGAPNVANSLTFSNVMIEHSGTRTDFAPYTKTTINLSDIFGDLEEVFPDYGASVNDNVYNYLDLEEMIYHHKVKTLKLGDYDYTDSYGSNRWSIPGNKMPTAKTDNLVGISFISSILTPDANVVMKVNNAHNMSACFYYADNSLMIKNADITTGTQLKEKLANSTLNYELAEEELIPLSSIIPPIHVEPNGSIEFVNEHNLDVPSKTIYKKTI